MIGLFEEIRGFLMEKIEIRTSWIRKCNGPVDPTIKILIERREKFLENGVQFQMVREGIKSVGQGGNSLLYT